MDLMEFKKKVSVKIDDNYLKSIISSCVQNFAYVLKTFKFDIAKVFEYSLSSKGKDLVNPKDVKAFFQDILKIASTKKIDKKTIVGNINSKKGYQTITSWDLSLTDELYDECHILSLNPKAADLMGTIRLIFSNMCEENIPFHIEIPTINDLGNGFTDSIKLYTNTEYLLKTLEVIEFIVNNNPNSFYGAPVFGAKYSETIGYVSYDKVTGLSQKQFIGKIIMSSIYNSIDEFIQHNEEVEVNISGKKIKLKQIENDDNRILLLSSLYPSMGRNEKFINSVLKKVKEELLKNDISLSNIFMNKSSLSNLNNMTFDKTNYINKYLPIMSEEDLNEIIMVNGAKMPLINLFEMYNILDVIPYDAKIRLVDDVEVNGLEFWQKFAIQLPYFRSIDVFIDAYTSEIINSKSKESGIKGSIHNIFNKG